MLVLMTVLASLTGDAPLPKLEELRQRAIESEKRNIEAQERYSCRLRSEETTVDKDGRPKKTKVEDEEEFYVNGHPISRLLARDGKPLSADDERKEDEKARKETLKWSDAKRVEKEKRDEQKQMDYVLHSLRLTNERRVNIGGRSAIAVDVAGDPSAKTSDIEQKFLQAVEGQLVLDEETGQVAELDIHTVRDVKIGLGLANLHKGFKLHLKQSPRADGAWLTDFVEGSGDARAFLFAHPRFQFRQVRTECRLYNVEVKTAEAKTK